VHVSHRRDTVSARTCFTAAPTLHGDPTAGITDRAPALANVIEKVVRSRSGWPPPSTNSTRHPTTPSRRSRLGTLRDRTTQQSRHGDGGAAAAGAGEVVGVGGGVGRAPVVGADSGLERGGGRAGRQRQGRAGVAGRPAASGAGVEGEDRGPGGGAVAGVAADGGRGVEAGAGRARGGVRLLRVVVVACWLVVAEATAGLTQLWKNADRVRV